MKLPCGYNTGNFKNECKRKHHWWNTYWIKDEIGIWELRCLFCHHTIIFAGKTITFKEWLFKKVK